MSIDSFSHVIFEALQLLEPGADANAVVDRVRRLQIGLPAEDEFSVLLTWLGRCRLVHKLDQLQSPRESRKHWQVPDLLAVFDYHGHEVPVLIEVKTSQSPLLSWKPAYFSSLSRYAQTVGVPLLVAWRYSTFWMLFDVRHLIRDPTNHKLKFQDAMKNSLMGELAGDFSFSLLPGSGLYIKIRKVAATKDGFDGRIEEAYWLNAGGKRFTKAAGAFPLFLCLEQDSEITEDGLFVTQSFVIPKDRNAEFAHRALVTLLRFSTDGRDLDWRKTLESGTFPRLAEGGLRQASHDAVKTGFLEYLINYRPAVLPDFLSAQKS